MSAKTLLLLFFVFPVLSFQNAKPKTMKVEEHWEEAFNEAEKTKMRTWLQPVVKAVEKRLGFYPFPLHFHFYRKDKAGEPAPWAHTKRWEGQQIHFHVNTAYSLQEFLDDWTAPHEISHLSIPYLGSEYSWFAEGFASFLQYQIMVEMGIISAKEMEERYAVCVFGIKHHVNSLRC